MGYLAVFLYFDYVNLFTAILFLIFLCPVIVQYASLKEEVISASKCFLFQMLSLLLCFVAIGLSTFRESLLSFDARFSAAWWNHKLGVKCHIGTSHACNQDSSNPTIHFNFLQQMACLEIDFIDQIALRDSGAPLSFTAWSPDSPHEDGTLNCASMSQDHGYFWKDDYCYDFKMAICEK